MDHELDFTRLQPRSEKISAEEPSGLLFTNFRGYVYFLARGDRSSEHLTGFPTPSWKFHLKGRDAASSSADGDENRRFRACARSGRKISASGRQPANWRHPTRLRVQIEGNRYRSWSSLKCRVWKCFHF